MAGSSGPDRQGPEPAVFGFHERLDRLIHEPARLAIVSLLAVVEEADFVFILDRTGLTGGNLGSHMSRLENGGYVVVSKRFVDRKPRTTYRLTAEGRAAFQRYRKQLDSVLERGSQRRGERTDPGATRRLHSS